MQSVFSRAWRAVAPALLLLAAACGGGSGSGQVSSAGAGATAQGCSGSNCGTAMVTLTDANGDFASYALDVTSVQLQRADGTVLETLPAVQHVDFAQLVDVSELLSALSVPAGNYVSGSFTVDYTNAAVSVEVGGNPTAAAVVNAAGVNPGVVTLNLQLDPARPLVVTPGHIARLALDFNLAASNTVDLTKTPPVVTAQPFVVASLVPSDTRQTRVRGALVSVNAGGNSYLVNVKPFDDDSTATGQVTVNTTSTTAFEINGTPSTGTAGLTALAALPTGTMVAAFGTLQTTDQSFTATQVLAGTSLQNTKLDSIAGNVIARSGTTLTVRGASFWRPDGTDSFMPKDVTILLGTGTGVTQAGSTATGLTNQAISVGQRITAFGTATTDASGKTTLDATAGRVRLEYTRIWGSFGSAGAGLATINLQAVDALAGSAFNFAGTGSSTAQDANPASYTVATGTLPLNAVGAGAATRFIGFVTPFGSAPPDFTASTLVNFTSTTSDLQINWTGGGATAPFVSAAAAGIVIDLGNANLGMLHSVRTGPAVTDLKSIAGNPKLVPDGASTALYAIGTDRAHVKTFAAFADFVTELNTRLAAGAKVGALWGRGSFDATADTFTADQLALQLE